MVTSDTRRVTSGTPTPNTTSSTTPLLPTTPSNTDTDNSSGLSVGAKVGIGVGVGVILAAVAVAVLLFICLRRARSRRRLHQTALAPGTTRGYELHSHPAKHELHSEAAKHELASEVAEHHAPVRMVVAAKDGLHPQVVELESTPPAFGRTTTKERLRGGYLGASGEKHNGLEGSTNTFLGSEAATTLPTSPSAETSRSRSGPTPLELDSRPIPHSLR